MKFFLAFVALVAVAVANPLHKPNDAALAELDAIMAAIHSPNTDPATALLLEQQLAEILASFQPGTYEPIVVGPAVVDSYQPISVGPAIVDSYEPISVGPAIIDSDQPISVGPAIVDSETTFEEIAVGPALVDQTVPAAPAASSAPLVQIIVNVAGSNIAGNPVSIEEAPAMIDRPIPVATPEEIIVPTPVVVAPEAEQVIVPEPVIVAPEITNPEQVIIPEPVIVAPEITNPEQVIVPEPVIVAPEITFPEQVIVPEPVIVAPEVTPNLIPEPVVAPDDLN